MRTTLVSIAAKNVHKMLAPWCLKAYAGAQGFPDIKVVEINVNNPVGEIVAKIYETKPQVVGFSCYIWNIDSVCKIGGLLKKLLPDVSVILGGPEVSFERDCRNYPFADYIIKGQGERAFCELLERFKNRNLGGSDARVLDGYRDDFAAFPSPFTNEYFDSFAYEQIPQIENRLVYYESTRGCPFSCAYCLSSTESGVQTLPMERVKRELSQLIAYGARCIKFVDRTFNADKQRAAEILEFIGSLDTTCVFHFEAAADLFDAGQLNIIKALPLGRVQFEIGVQSVQSETIAATARVTDLGRVFQNIRSLLSFQNCHVHVDLIAGLPFETLFSFQTAVDRCIAVRPHALQLGFLKRLKGTRIDGSADSFGAVFADFAPYEVYKTDTLCYEDILKLKKIEQVIDQYFNSGLYASSIGYALDVLFLSPYRFFEAFSDDCVKKGINPSVLSLKNSYRVLFDFLSLHGSPAQAAHYIKLDCLGSDPKGQLPDAITSMRNKQAEQSISKEMPKGTNFRIEFFEFDNTHRLFVYDRKNSVTNQFPSKALSV